MLIQADQHFGVTQGILGDLCNRATQCGVRAEGNPLFLQQLLRSKPQDGDAKLPHSIQGVVLARLDSLAEQDRHALRAASVLGQRFVLGDLQALLGTAIHDLAALIDRQLLKHEGDGLLCRPQASCLVPVFGGSDLG